MYLNNFKLGLVSIAVLSFLSNVALADTTKNAGSHGPSGIHGDHVHNKGKWMVGYSYKFVKSSGVRDGNDTVDAMDVLHKYGEVATDMEMQMHMFEIMYGVTDKLSIMLMPQYMKMSMSHLSHGGHGSHEHEIDGLGDTELSAIYSLFDKKNDRGSDKFNLNFGVSLPTGSVDNKFTNHHGKTYNLPYMMQLGSGTVDPILGFTYSKTCHSWYFGLQNLNYIRVGENDENYRLGNLYKASAWVGNNVTENVALSLRVEGESWGNVSGQAKDLPITAIAGANPDEVGGKRVNLFAGVNLYASEKQGKLNGNRLNLEVGLPVYEYYEGPQTDTDYQVNLSWQFAF